MGRTGITQTDVDAAADRLLLAGERVTVERLRQELGTGSLTTVQRLLDVWWGQLGARVVARARLLAVPDAPPGVGELAGQLWTAAVDHARTLAADELASERNALAERRDAAEVRVSAAETARNAAQAAAAEAANALQTARQRLKDRQRLVDHQAEQLADLARQRDHTLQRLEAASAQIQTLRDRVDTLLREADAARDAQSAHLRAVEDRAHTEVDRARHDARERDKALRAAEKAHAQRVRELEQQLAHSRAEAVQATRELAAEQARRETMAQQLAEVHRRLDAALKPSAPAARTTSSGKSAATRRPRTG